MSERDEVLEALYRARDALVQVDSAALDELWGDEYASVTTLGTVRSKQEALAGVEAGDAVYEALEYDELDVRVYGETAVVRGRVHARGSFRGTPFTPQPSRFTLVYVRRGGRWQAVAHQATKADL